MEKRNNIYLTEGAVVEAVVDLGVLSGETQGRRLSGFWQEFSFFVTVAKFLLQGVLAEAGRFDQSLLSEACCPRFTFLNRNFFC